MAIKARDILPRLALCLGFVLLLSGCESLSYYGQAAAGQFSLMIKKVPISRVLEDPAVSPALKSRLELVLELRAFAVDELQLPVENQFSDYVDIEREAVVWNVFAAPELALEARVWCYPIAGCAAYRGYFSEQQAQDYATRLTDEGYDSWVGAVAAYSTLGWLNDPVMNTFVHREELQLADLLFHELAHKLLYVPGDTVFNESFATSVAAEGVRRWVQHRHRTDQYQRYQSAAQQEADFVQLVTAYRTQFGALYGSSVSDADKRREKSALIEQLRGDYQSLQLRWGGSQAYSHWMAAPINNAKLNSVALYNDLVPGLKKLLEDEDHNLENFYQRCRGLEALDVAERRDFLTLH